MMLMRKTGIVAGGTTQHRCAPPASQPAPTIRKGRATLARRFCGCAAGEGDAGAAGPGGQESTACMDGWDRAALMNLLHSKAVNGGALGRPQHTQHNLSQQLPGEVFLVGTGPGDPGLLTLRAVQLMATADVVLYDRLVSEDVLQLVNPGARMVYVGKAAGFHSASQEEIHQMLLTFASAGARVVRLKGGDPYVFGRGGEEVGYLREHGISVHCVPGITAAAGICAELGIPMTHRGVATSVRFLTGHSREGGETALHESIAAAADPATTLVVYMGLQTLPSLVAQLTSHGLSPSTPAVAVERGTTAQQRVVYGTLSDLYQRTQALQLRSPTLLLIGEVVALAAGWGEWHASGRPVAEAPSPVCARLAADAATSMPYADALDWIATAARLPQRH